MDTIARELGRLSEAMDRSREDRIEMKDALAKVSEGLDALRGGVSSLNQTMQSTATQVATIGMEKCGERLDKIEGTVFSADFRSSTTRLSRVEATVTRWEGWIGSGRAFAGKVILAVIASGVLGGTIFGYASKIASHL